MGDERYPRSNDPQADYYGRREAGDYGRDYGSGRSSSYSSARSYQAAGEMDRDRGGERQGQRDRGSQQDRQGGGEYRGSYASDGRRFENVGRYSDRDDDGRADMNRERGAERERGYGRQPQGYENEDRGFFQRAGDEVRSWFGDDDAERRREGDARMDEQRPGQDASDHRDSDYHSWRRGQMDAFDRDYQEYREENRKKFHDEFATWRTARQGQRDLLPKVTEHMEVVGSDGGHVGTVDKVRDDRVILTKNDEDAGGRHHSFPSRWIDKVDAKVTLTKSAQEAKDHWRDEERNTAMFSENSNQARGQADDRNGPNGQARSNAQGRASAQGDGSLNRSFSGTY